MYELEKINLLKGINLYYIKDDKIIINYYNIKEKEGELNG